MRALPIGTGFVAASGLIAADEAGRRGTEEGFAQVRAGYCGFDDEGFFVCGRMVFDFENARLWASGRTIAAEDLARWSSNGDRLMLHSRSGGIITVNMGTVERVEEAAGCIELLWEGSRPEPSGPRVPALNSRPAYFTFREAIVWGWSLNLVAVWISATAAIGAWMIAEDYLIEAYRWAYFYSGLSDLSYYIRPIGWIDGVLRTLIRWGTPVLTFVFILPVAAWLFGNVIKRCWHVLTGSASKRARVPFADVEPARAS